MIQNKGHHEHEYQTECECKECECDICPYGHICYFCENGNHFEEKGKRRWVGNVTTL